MSKEMIKTRIEELEEQKFYLNLTGHWTGRDYDRYYEIMNEIRKLKKALDN